MDTAPFLPLSSSSSSSSSSSAIAMDGVVDYRGDPVSRFTSGGWTAALFIIGVELAERFAYYGVSSNLITYLTGPLQESTASAAAAVNTWSGMASMLPLAGAFVADSYLGRHRTILVASLLYILGLGLLTLSSVLPSLRPPKCSINYGKTCSPSSFQVFFFYFSLYLVALAQGFHKPCTQAFGADQFDEKDPEEGLSRSSFFNWWFFGLCLSISITIIILPYVQDNVSWALGFGLPFIAMGIALIIFLIGTKKYRIQQLKGRSPFLRIGKSFAALIKGTATSEGSELHHSKIEGEGQLSLGIGLYFSSLTANSPFIEFLAAHSSLWHKSDKEPNDLQIEEAKGLLRLFPLWLTCLIYGIVYAQSSTFFTKQGFTLDRKIGSSFQVPPAALQSFISISIVAFVPIYDQILVPLTRKLSRIPTGITKLQRIAAGIVLSILSMTVAALVEMKRLKTAKDYGLIDQPEAIIPMSLWWLAPQYIFCGITEVFTLVGMQEFFYDQVPDELRSIGLALYYSIFGIGNFISSFLISVINKTTRSRGESWFSDNLNSAHLDYFYWLLAGLSFVELIVFLVFSRAYVYKKQQITAE